MQGLLNVKAGGTQSTAAFSKQGSAKHRYVFREKSQNARNEKR
jgi:hypothetical protein